MVMGEETDWRNLFRVQPVEPTKIQTCGCASGSCKTAKKFRCLCSCKHEFHGINAKSELADLREKLFTVEDAILIPDETLELEAIPA